MIGWDFTPVAVAALLAGLFVCVLVMIREGRRAEDREIARGLETMRYLPERGEGDVLAGRWEQ